MKKTISKVLALILSLVFIFQTSMVTFAEDTPDWEDTILSQEEFNDILAQNQTDQSETRTSGLIFSYGIAISSDGSYLLIAGRTKCDPYVIKCGFTVVTIKRRTSSSASWTTYKTYEDLYNDSSSYTLSKKISVPTGYQYRVYCTHYAKKNLFSREKIDNASNVLAIR